jgi:hypothetical protein
MARSVTSLAVTGPCFALIPNSYMARYAFKEYCWNYSFALIPNSYMARF